MKKKLRIIGGMYLGFALAHFANINFMNWRFYVILIPFFILWLIGEDDEV